MRSQAPKGSEGLSRDGGIINEELKENRTEKNSFLIFKKQVGLNMCYKIANSLELSAMAAVPCQHGLHLCPASIVALVELFSSGW
jgi:hypothetical protein